MAIIYSYSIATPQDTDLLIISRTPTDPDEISNYSVNMSSVADYVIDRFINPDATDFQIPVFNQGGTRITGSIISQDSSPSNGVAGTKITIAGNTTTTGDAQIDTLTNNYIPVNNNSGVLRDSGFYQSPSSAAVTAGAISLNTTFSDTNYGEIPGLRVASRVINTPGVIDLFRNDASVTTGESVGILQYSVLDDGRYAVAQIGVETLSTSGSGDSGGGKFLFKTAKGGSSGPSQNTPESRFTLDYNSADFLVPINVTSTAQSSFAGQVTIPITPVANTDAASKAYVDARTGLAYLTPQLLTASATGLGTIDPSYNLVLLNWTGGNGVYTLNLPLASANTNRLIRITTDGTLSSGAGDKIDITATGGETIDGNPSFRISKQYEGLAVFSTGTEWIIVQAKAH